MPFATVRVMKGKLLMGGVVSNIDGDFQIPSKYRTVMDSIVVTCIGYANKVLKINELKEGSLNIIKLRTGSVQLKEVIVTPQKMIKLSAHKIVGLAIKKIPENYPTLPFSYVAYYRDYQKENNEYINLNEAIIGIFDDGFTENDLTTTQIELYQYRPNKEFKRDSTTETQYDNQSGGNKFVPYATISSFGGNELSILRIHDAIRNYEAKTFSFVNLFRYDFLKNHTFKLLETAYKDDVPLYHISFQTLYFATGANYTAKGEIFIEPRNYAIHKLIYSTYLKEGKNETLLYNIQVEYARIDSLFYPNYISLYNIFEAKSNEGFQVLDVVFNLSNKSFTITFNHTPEKFSVLTRTNYDFKFDTKSLKINRIERSEKDDKKVNVFVETTKDIKLWKNPKVLTQKIEVKFKNIKDMEGNEINALKYKNVNQFRELFLQKLIPSVIHSETGLFINKQKPLAQNPIDSMHINASNYWMNTPLKKD